MDDIFRHNDPTKGAIIESQEVEGWATFITSMFITSLYNATEGDRDKLSPLMNSLVSPRCKWRSGLVVCILVSHVVFIGLVTYFSW